MKKALSVIVIIFLIAGSFLIFGSGSFSLPLETDRLSYGQLTWNYHTAGEVTGHLYHQYYAGSPVSLRKGVTDSCDKGEVILEYRSEYGKLTGLKSEKRGWIMEIGLNEVVIMDDDLFVEAYLPYEFADLTAAGDELVIEQGGKYVTGQIRSIGTLGVTVGGRCCLKAEITGSEELAAGVAAVVSFTLKSEEGLIAPRDDLLELDGQYYLLSAGLADDPLNWHRYLLPVEIKLVNGSQVLLEADLEPGLSICRLTESLREALGIDKD